MCIYGNKVYYRDKMDILFDSLGISTYNYAVMVYVTEKNIARRCFTNETYIPTEYTLEKTYPWFP